MLDKLLEMEIQAFLQDATLPEDREGGERIARVSKRNVLVEETLFRRGANGVLRRILKQASSPTIVHGRARPRLKASWSESRQDFIANRAQTPPTWF